MTYIQLHAFTETAIVSIYNRYSNPRQYGRSKQNIEAVGQIMKQAQMIGIEHSARLEQALIEARPILVEARAVAQQIRRNLGLTTANVDGAVNALKRVYRAERGEEAA